MLTLFFVLTVAPAGAQEIIVYGGASGHTRTDSTSYTWGVEYLQGLGEQAAFSVSWLNEGHLPDHHRDGQCVQLWGRSAFFNRRLSLAAGLGPYLYYDTVPAAVGRTRNTRGLAAIASLTATWYRGDRWLIQLRSNFIETQASIDTASLALGIGYQLDPPPAPGPLPKAPSQVNQTTSNEISLLIGRTIVNDSRTPSAAAVAFEYRRGLGRYVDWTVGWLSEGDDHRTYRNGPLTELWAVRSFFDERLALGAGAGFHLDFFKEDPHPGEEKITTLAGVTSITAAYRLPAQWLARITWNRIITDYHRDADVFVGGLGYRF